jgi:hypothetical protein
MGNMLGSGGIGGTIGSNLGVQTDTDTVSSGTSVTGGVTNISGQTTNISGGGTNETNDLSAGQIAAGTTGLDTTSKLKLEDEAVQKIIQDVLGGSGGLAEIFGGEQTSGPGGYLHSVVRHQLDRPAQFEDAGSSKPLLPFSRHGS